MRDSIDERDYREKRARSIVKFYNVNYIPKDEEESATGNEQGKNTEEKPSAGKIAPLEDDDRWDHVPSSGYGKMVDDDPVTEEQIKQILGERESTFEAMKESSKPSDI